MRNKYVSKRGYVMVRVAFGGERKHGWEQYRKEHILVMESKLGRRLRRGEKVHHLNGNKQDNRITNLLLTNNREHAHIHSSLNEVAYTLIQDGRIGFCRKTKRYKLKG